MSRALSFGQLTPQLLATASDTFEKLLRNGYFTENYHAFMCNALFKCDDINQIVALLRFEHDAPDTTGFTTPVITPIRIVKAMTPTLSALSSKTEVLSSVPSSISKDGSESPVADVFSAIFAKKCAEKGIKAGTPVTITVSPIIEENDITKIQADVEEAGRLEYEVLLCGEKDVGSEKPPDTILDEHEAIHDVEAATEGEQETSEDQIVVPITVVQPQEQELKTGGFDDTTQVSEPVERTTKLKESEAIAAAFQQNAPGLVAEKTNPSENVLEAQDALTDDSIVKKEEIAANSGARPITPPNTSAVSSPIIQTPPNDANAEMIAWCQLSPRERELKRAEKRAALLRSPIKFGATHKDNKDIVPWKFDAVKADKDLFNSAARQQAMQPELEVVYVDIYKEVKVTDNFERVKAASPSKLVVRETISLPSVKVDVGNSASVKTTSQAVAQIPVMPCVSGDTAAAAGVASVEVITVSSACRSPEVTHPEGTEPKKQEKYFGRPVFNQDGDVLGAHAPPLASDNKGRKMLENLGYKSGSGLGKHNNGVLNPTPQTIKNTKAGLGMDLKTPGVPTPFTPGPQQAWDTHKDNASMAHHWRGPPVTKSSNTENRDPSVGRIGALPEAGNQGPKNNSASKPGNFSGTKKPQNRAIVVRLRYESECKPSGNRSITFNSRTGGFGGRPEKRGKTHHYAGVTIEARETRCGGDGLLATDRGNLLEVIEQLTDCEYLVKQKFGQGLQGVIKVFRMDMSTIQFDAASTV